MHELLGWFIQGIHSDFKIDWPIVEPFLETRQLSWGERLFHEGDSCEFVGLNLTGCLRIVIGTRAVHPWMLEPQGEAVLLNIEESFEGWYY